jgi:Rha family phage regulatory protein
MEDLVIMNNNQAVTTSLVLAEVFEKKHQHVLRDIDALKDVSNFGQMFFESNEPDSYGRNRRIYFMNRDGFTLIAMGYTGSKAMEFKLKYIDAFNRMEEQIKSESQFRLPTNFDEMTLMLSNVMQGQEKKIEEQGKKVDFLMDLSGLTSSRNKELTKARNKKVIQVCGGAESNSYKDKSLRSKIYKELFKSFRNHFDVSQYVDTPMRYFDKAKDFISNWYPPFELKEEIELRNAQENLF